MLTSPTSYNEFFLSSLTKLNDAQRHAVEETEGPILVLAGPGTGKTHILASRIGNILIKTDAQAHNILCLTYTDAGSIAMRQRLLELIGPEAHKVHIFTYHAFCSHVIKSNPEFFGRNKLEILTKLEKTDLIRSILDELPAAHILVKNKSDYFYENHLANLFELIKKEDWTLAHIETMIDDYLAQLKISDDFFYKKNTKTAQKGDFKQREFDEIALKMSVLREAAQLFPIYQQKLSNANRYDFNDMINWVIKAFEENENLLLNYQEQYLYFLVDEFQDTNGSQNHILKTLMSYWDNPNVFIVGDDDQAIFEFQGARLQSFDDFYRKYQEDIQVVVLKENYRSSQPVLDAARELINVNKLRVINSLSELNVDKYLIAANDKVKNIDFLPQVIAYENDLAELSDIIQQIEIAQKNGEKLSEIAILYAQNKQADEFLSIFEKKGIPFSTRRSINILREPIIQQVIFILEYIAQELTMPTSGDALLFKILHFRCWNIPSSTIAQLSILLQKQGRISWRTALANQEFLDQNEIPNSEELRLATQFLTDCIENTYENGVLNLVERIINRSGILSQVIDSQYDVQNIQVLRTFFEFVQQENNKDTSFSVISLYATLEKMLDNHITLDIQRSIDHQDGVFFSTVHSAKGLEFERVYMIGCEKKHWESQQEHKQNQFSLPTTLTLTEEIDLLESRRRLFYVGMTRAKKELFISYSEEENGKQQECSVFVEELKTQNKITFIAKKIERQALLSTAFVSLNDKKVLLPNQKEAFLQQRLQDFVLSASSMIAYLECPLSFYFDSILGVPSQPSETAAYGSILHKTLQSFFDRSVFGNKKQMLSVDVLLDFFNKEMENKRHFFPPKTYRNRLENGLKDLRLFYENEVKNWSFNGQSEVHITNTEINGVPVKGTIDKVIHLQNGTVELIDYKTTTLKTTHFSKSSAANPGGGNYRKQLIFYKLLYQHWRNTTRTVSQATLVYLIPDFQENFGSKTLVFEEDEVHQFQQLIKEVYDKIMQHDFYKGCGKKTCQWCEFVKTQVLPNSVFNELIGELDE